MIQTFRAKNFGCLLDVEATLTPLHAFIGPNDSGKSTILHGLWTLVQFARRRSFRDHEEALAAFDAYAASDGVLACMVDAHEFQVRAPLQRTPHQPTPALVDELHGARLVRLDPDALRKPSGLIPETGSIDFLDDRGHGLAGIFFAIRNRNDDAFAAIVADVRKHFPTIKNLRVKAVTSSEVTLEAELIGGARIESKRFSEGLLYYLAFAALRHLDPVSLLLVEEPENGLHPARIAEVVRILRAIVEESGTQVVMATHSPLVVNELRPEEVSVVTRTATEGTRVKRIQDTPDFEERFKVYALGELWIAYANGEDEAPLLQGTEP
ncbi:AAA family ATPase [Polyangium spumosum]|uniref:AAA family ATPase n=1 Tax=Polyangium spumosum TaxID=889282 RepID=A0A6N7PNV7_9BACT|nr:ATP-binding protein [Polyangium spumosum]MRG91814.1 AAA family ATPase [Polyangium spumosum]